MDRVATTRWDSASSTTVSMTSSCRAPSRCFLDYLATGASRPRSRRRWWRGFDGLSRERVRPHRRRRPPRCPASTRKASTTWPGFIVGVVENDRLVTGAALRPRHAARAAFDGLHTNATRSRGAIVFEHAGLKPDYPSSMSSLHDWRRTAAVHRSYCRVVRPLLEAGLVKGLAHITGAASPRNLPRILRPARPPHRQDGLGAERRVPGTCSGWQRSRRRRCSARSTWASA